MHSAPSLVLAGACRYYRAIECIRWIGPSASALHLTCIWVDVPAFLRLGLGVGLAASEGNRLLGDS